MKIKSVEFFKAHKDFKIHTTLFLRYFALVNKKYVLFYNELGEKWCYIGTKKKRSHMLDVCQRINEIEKIINIKVPTEEEFKNIFNNNNLHFLEDRNTKRLNIMIAITILLGFLGFVFNIMKVCGLFEK